MSRFNGKITHSPATNQFLRNRFSRGPAAASYWYKPNMCRSNSTCCLSESRSSALKLPPRHSFIQACIYIQHHTSVVTVTIGVTTHHCKDKGCCWDRDNLKSLLECDPEGLGIPEETGTDCTDELRVLEVIGVGDEILAIVDKSK